MQRVGERVGERIERWGAAVQALLAGPEGVDAARWGREVERRLVALTGADGCVVHVPSGMAGGRGEDADADPGEGVAAAQDHGVRRGLPDDEALFLARADLARAGVHGPVTLWVRPAPDACAWLTVYRTAPVRPGQVDGMAADLDSLLPAFRAAALSRWRFALERTELARALRVLGRVALVCDASARVLLATDALAALERERAGDGRIRGAMEDVARRLARARSRGEPASELEREVEDRPRARRVYGRVIDRSGLTGDRTLIVVLAEPAPVPSSRTRWKAAFGLTTRETEVAWALAEGASNRAIAERLAISPNTVQNHVRRILGKLDVPSRAAVAARLRDARDAAAG